MNIYIYVLKDPITNKIRYVGKTNDLKSRLNCHLYHKDTNKHKVSWIKKLRKQKLKPIIEAVREVTVDDWKIWEKYYIKKYTEDGFKLLNYTEGGDGLTFKNKTSFKKGQGSKRIVILSKDGHIKFDSGSDIIYWKKRYR